MLENILNAITRLPMDRLGRNLGGHMSAVIQLRRRRPLPSYGALNILQSWATGGRTREPILMKFGTQQQFRTAMTIMRSNIKIFKIQNGGRPPCWKYIRNAITRLPMHRLGRNLGGRSEGVWPPNVNLGPPIISDTKRGRKVRLKTPLDIVTYSPLVQKKIR